MSVLTKLEMFDPQSRRGKLLCAEFGAENVEETLIFIAGARDRKGLRVMIPLTYEMVRDILEAVHGRLNVGDIKCWGTGKDESFYHFPTGADDG